MEEAAPPLPSQRLDGAGLGLAPPRSPSRKGGRRGAQNPPELLRLLLRGPLTFGIVHNLPYRSVFLQEGPVSVLQPWRDPLCTSYQVTPAPATHKEGGLTQLPGSLPTTRRAGWGRVGLAVGTCETSRPFPASCQVNTGLRFCKPEFRMWYESWLVLLFNCCLLL